MTASGLQSKESRYRHSDALVRQYIMEHQEM
jgi:hypothetical protein